METLTGIKACVYVNNGQKNSQLVRFGGLTHIQLLHGESDKSASFSKVTRMFDRIFVAGQAGIDRYAQNGVVIAPEQFDIVGRPQLEGVKEASVKVREVPRPTVLYAPTWEGMYTDSNYSSLPVGDRIVEELVKREMRVIFRPHPYSYKSDIETAHIKKVQLVLERANQNLTSGREPHLFGELAETKRSLFECFNESDFLISDVSSVSADYLMSQKPMVIYNYLGDDKTFNSNFPITKYAYALSKDLINASSIIDDISTNDSMAALRAQGKAHVLGDFPATEASHRFVAAIRKCL
jgi:CDP-glycerol glycerophosphotransferase (TagB/SpsB family)